MTNASPICPLCEAPDAGESGFRQRYPQKGADPVVLGWYKCRACKALVVHPIPSSEMIARYWGTVAYANEQRKDQIFEAKVPLLEHLLRELEARTTKGPLLDVGSSFGGFLIMARDQGWDTQGYEPNGKAAAVTRRLGFTVHSGWALEACPFAPGTFAAVVAVDVFYYSWHPARDLRTYLRLLRPGGLLAMRLTNKRLILGLAHILSRGAIRDQLMSRLLQAQFHSISMPSLTRVLKAIGFDNIMVVPGALTCPLESLSFAGRWAYRLSNGVWHLSARRANLSPGVILFARRPLSSGS